ncbi:MAG: hypothetical protein EOM59_15420 [Clostridia bacterium]|nr:hypothetical protein [Clostridia bacterium]NCD09842.1 hypothetical protein [Negativicutes bacterium]
MKKFFSMMLVVLFVISFISIPIFAEVTASNNNDSSIIRTENTSVEIYSDNFPVELKFDTKESTALSNTVTAWVKFRITYTAGIGLGLYTEITTDPLNPLTYINNISGNYVVNAIQLPGISYYVPYYTSQFVPLPIIHNYEEIHVSNFPSGLQFTCTTSGTISCVGGSGSYSKTAIATIP